jgi:hypothetical protein
MQSVSRWIQQPCNTTARTDVDLVGLEPVFVMLSCDQSINTFPGHTCVACMYPFTHDNEPSKSATFCWLVYLVCNESSCSLIPCWINVTYGNQTNTYLFSKYLHGSVLGGRRALNVDVSCCIGLVDTRVLSMLQPWLADAGSPTYEQGLPSIEWSRL